MLKIKRVILPVLLVSVILAAIVTSLIKQETPKERSFSVVEDAWQVILQNYVANDQLDAQSLRHGAIRGMIESTGDPFARFFEPEEYKLHQEELEGAFGGIGAQVSNIEGQIIILSVLPGSPAEKTGILPNDIILQVDGVSTEGMSLNEAIVKIRGKPGTEVILTVLHKGQDISENIRIVRENIQQTSVSFKKLGNNTGLITLTEFTSDTDEELITVLENARANNTEGIILDLRNNGGGYLPTTVNVVSQFLGEGIVTYAVDNKGRKDTYDVKNGGLALDIHLVVLVNGNSASASEIVTGAIQDYKRGYIMGTQTRGKGSVNQFFPLDDGSAIYLSIEYWYTPNGRQIQGEGIIPDEIVEITQEDIEQGIDPQLNRAIEYIQNEINVRQ